MSSQKVSCKIGGSQPSEANRIVRDYLLEFPSIGHMAAARVLYGKYPAIWPSLKACDSMVRYIRGKAGKHAKKYLADHSQEDQTARSCAPIPKMPESIKRKVPFGPYYLEGPRKVLVISDCHMPFHDEEALETALQHGKKSGCDTVLINGDFVDFYRVSDHLKDPRTVDFNDERELAVQGLEYIRYLFPDADIIYKEGNHEFRLFRYLLVRAPELLNIDVFDMTNFLELDRLGIVYVQDKRPVMLGKLPCIHGHELPRGMSTSVNPARTLYLRAKESCLQSHTHKHSSNTEQTMSRHIIGTWSIAALCQLDPDWNPLMNGWMHGFAEINVEENGDYEVENYKIINGRPFLG